MPDANRRTEKIIAEVLALAGEAGKDLSFDIYCPKTYSHHNRLTYWMPGFYQGRLHWRAIIRRAKTMLKALKVKRTDDYVIGLNSRFDQYGAAHLLMLDIDCRDRKRVSRALRRYGPGWLFKTERGFHFIAARVFKDQEAWAAVMRRAGRDRALRGLVDGDHLERSLQRGYATLRLTASRVKPRIPVYAGRILGPK